MTGILFHEIVFGPVKSRRFGISLGINLLPVDSKLCSYDCIYCECGLTRHGKGHKPALFFKEQIMNALEQRLQQLKGGSMEPDSITFAGNGEPTLHPEFLPIMQGVVALRNKYFPLAKITVLSNATMLHHGTVREGLSLADNNVLKLDAGTDAVFQSINRPLSPLSINEIVSRLIGFNGNLIVQTLFIRGTINGKQVDNTTSTEVEAWLGHLRRIRPRLVMIYPIDRATPFATLEKISTTELNLIARQVKEAGIEAEVY